MRACIRGGCARVNLDVLANAGASEYKHAISV